MKIFEISFGRTGTSSLSKAAEILGYRVRHGWGAEYDEASLRELFDGQLPSFIEHYDLISDIAAPFYQELDEAYPGSKFILLVREEQAWLRSWINHTLNANFQPRINYQTFYRMLKLGCFWPHKNPQRALRAYHAHQKAVIDYFRDRPEDLLVIDICGGAGWEPLCDFLQKPVPEIPFPFENRGQVHQDDSHAINAPSENQPLVQAEAKPARPTDKPRVLFASYHCYLDPASGAALSTRDMLEMLAARGWPVRVFCGPKLDGGPSERVEQIVSDLQVPMERKTATEDSETVLHCTVNGVETSVYCPARRDGLTNQETQRFLALYERLLDRWQPDVLVTYGGLPIHPLLMHAAKRRGIRVVFSLRNFAYTEARLFQPADAILVPSQFSADHYLQHLGLDCTPIPSPIIWSRVKCQPDLTQRFVTFINPQLTKGVQVFARIAVELAKRRPEIPLLVVEGRGQADQLAKLDIDLSGCTNLHRMANTPDPRDFYRVSHLLLMPSLWNESFGRIPVEAIINGIPVLASDRGALPEVIGETNSLISLPAKYTQRSREIPTAEEVLPWITKILELWDNENLYQERSQSSRQAVEKFREDQVAGQYEGFFQRLVALEE